VLQFRHFNAVTVKNLVKLLALLLLLHNMQRSLACPTKTLIAQDPAL
jgi:hypothetical protein